MVPTNNGWALERLRNLKACFGATTAAYEIGMVQSKPFHVRPASRRSFSSIWTASRSKPLNGLNPVRSKIFRKR